MQRHPDNRAGSFYSSRYVPAAIILLWAVFFLSGIFTMPLMQPDEPKYAYAAAKMLKSGDYITPYFNCEPRFDKPPVIYWAIAASYRIFGVSDWAARIPSILAVLGVMLIIYREARRRFDSKSALFSVAVFAGLLHMWVMGRAVAPEMLLTLFQVASIFAFHRGLKEDSRRHIITGYVFSALAFLTKGPLGLLIPAGTVFLYFSYSKGIRYTLRRMLNPVGILLFLLIGLPWYVAMVEIHGYRYFEEFFLYHNVYRFTGKARQHPFPFYYYVPVLLGALYLWLPFGRQVWRGIRDAFRERTEGMFLVFWAAFVILFFTLSTNKLHNYILTAYPPIAIVIGSSISKATSGTRSARNIYTGLAVIETIGLGYAAFVMKSLPASVLVAGSFMLFMTLLAISRGNTFFKLTVMALLKGLAILIMAILFVANFKSEIKDGAELLRIRAAHDAMPVYFYKKVREDVVFYADSCVSKLDDREQLLEAGKKSDGFIVFIREKDIGDLEGLNKERLVPFNEINGKKEFLAEISTRQP